jgi:hypothetical protein
MCLLVPKPGISDPQISANSSLASTSSQFRSNPFMPETVAHRRRV